MRVLIAVDGSRHSEAALAAVLQKKWPESTILRLIYVIKKNESNAKGDMLRVTADSLGEIAQKLRKNPTLASSNIKVEHEILTGAPASSISSMARKWKAELIVMGTHGKRGVERLLGSVSNAVLNKSECPLLIVSADNHNRNLVENRDMERILIALDGSGSSLAAMRWIESQTWSNASVFKLITAIPEANNSIADERNAQKAAWMLKEWDMARERASLMLEEQALRLGLGLHNERISLDVVPGDPVERILALAKGWKAELIVLGTHGRGALGRLIVGSVSRKIAYSAPCSVLIVKGSAAECSSSLLESKSIKKPKATKARRPRQIESNDDRPPFTMM